MSIKVGDRLPDAKFTVMEGGKPKTVGSADLFKGRVALFAVPGAFTPTCSEAHLPGFVAHAGDIKSKGIDAIVCTAVNDVFVLSAWSKAREADDAVTMAADGNGDFAKAVGLDIDLSAFGLGIRSKRYAMIVENGVVEYLAIEDSPPEHNKATAEKLLAAI